MNVIQPVAAFVITTTFLLPPSSRWGRGVQSGDACALLTQAQVSAALGVSVDPGKPLIATNPRVCGWAPPGGPRPDGKKVVVTLMTTKSFETSKTPVPGIPKSPVSGVGDNAVYITTAGMGTGLNVKKGASAFQVRVGGFKEQQEKDIEKALAGQILAKM